MAYPTIGQLNRLVKLCSANDVIQQGAMFICRTDVRDIFALIKPKSAGSSWSREGYNTEEKPTHEITVRSMPDIDVTAMAWFYELRRISQNMWYKIIDVKESPDGEWWVFNARVTQRSDFSQPKEKNPCEPVHPGLDLHRSGGVDL